MLKLLSPNERNMISLFLCVLAIAISRVHSAIPTFDYYSACDDVQHVYSGHAKGVDELGFLDDWMGTLKVKVPTITQVLAVSCFNKGGPAGILGSTTDNRILTNNATWKCSNKYENNWNSANFDDKKWSPAVHVDTNRAPGPHHYGWKLRPEINSKAAWISSRKRDISANSTLYCRLKLVYEFRMICDDNSTLYADGVWIGAQGMATVKGYKYVSNPFKIPKMATMFAISCQNNGGFTGFMGATSSGDLVTDSQWKVNNLAFKKNGKNRPVEPAGWFEPEFNDSKWKNALQIIDNKSPRPQGKSWIPEIKEQVNGSAWWIGAVPQPILTGKVDRKDRSVLLIRRKLDCLWTHSCQ